MGQKCWAAQGQSSELPPPPYVQVALHRGSSPALTRVLINLCFLINRCLDFHAAFLNCPKDAFSC